MDKALEDYNRKLVLMFEDEDYEVKEREAILLENNPEMHPAHARNKAKKEIREREKGDGT